LLPPVVFVEWLASMPIEIELIASLPISGQPAQTVELYNPPDTSPNNVFSRVALVRTERQIYTSSLFSREKGKGEPQCKDVFEQLKAILKETESDMVHMAKATYFTSDDDGSRGYDLVRPRLLDSARPPAASKVMVFGVGPESRSLSLDMIAVGAKR
jgi:enamine deaminase RidA (YjgF/YER057c/UK114 family)